MEDDKTLFTPLNRMPRASERSKLVFAAHRGKDAMLDAQGETMVAAAADFEARDVELARLDELVIVARAERDAAVTALQQAKRRCLEAVARDLQDFDTRGFTDSPVAEDAIAQSTTLRARVEARTQDGDVPAYVAKLLQALTSTQETAELAMLAAHEAAMKAGEARTERRRAAVQLDNKLIAFRRIVRSVLGSSHRDYRMLRPAGVRAELEDELDIVELPNEGPDTIANDTENPDEPELPEAAGGTG